MYVHRCTRKKNGRNEILTTGSFSFFSPRNRSVQTVPTVYNIIIIMYTAVSHLKYVLEREQTPPQLFAFGVHQFVCKIITTTTTKVVIMVIIVIITIIMIITTRNKEEEKKRSRFFVWTVRARRQRRSSSNYYRRCSSRAVYNNSRSFYKLLLQIITLSIITIL